MAFIISFLRVLNKVDLYTLPAEILSDSGTNEGNDAIGQVWYTVTEGKWFKLINWSKRNQSAGWEERIIPLASDYANLSNAIALYQTQLDSFDIRIIALETKIASIESQIQTHQVTIESFARELTSIGSNQASLSSNLSQAVARISALETAVEHLPSDFPTKEEVQTLATNLNALEIRVLIVENAYAGISNQISTVTTSLTTVTTNLNQVVTNVEALQTRVSSVESTILNHTQRIADLNDDINPVEIQFEQDKFVFEKSSSSVAIDIRWSLKVRGLGFVPETLFLIVTQGSVSTRFDLAEQATSKLLSIQATSSATVTLYALSHQKQFTKSVQIIFVNPTYFGALTQVDQQSIIQLSKVAQEAHTLKVFGANFMTRYCYSSPNSLGYLQHIYQDGIDMITSFIRTTLTLNGEIYNIYTLLDNVTVDSVNFIFE